MDDQGEYRKYRKSTGPGKGPERRKGADDSKFRDNYDTINWKKKDENVANKSRVSTGPAN